MKYQVITNAVNGSSVTDYTALEGRQAVIFETESHEEAMQEFEIEVERHKKAGGEVKVVGSDRAFFINESNRPYMILDVIEA
jgi:hypothetical protein